MSINNFTSDINQINKNNNKSVDTSKIIFYFRNSLSNLLGTIKLNYNYYPATQRNLNIIIEKMEELILSLNNTEYFTSSKKSTNNNSNDEIIHIKKKNNNEEKLFDLFYYFVTINTNSTFYDFF